LVSFVGNQRLLYRANIWLRTAIRVLKPIHQFAAGDEKSLYRGVQEIEWSNYLDPTSSLAIDPVVHNSFCTHSLYAAQLAKDLKQRRDGLKAFARRFYLHLSDRVDVRGTLHLDFSDMAFWGGPLRERSALGTIPPARAAELTALIVRQYFDQELLGRRSTLLAGASVPPELTVRTVPPSR
jgi:hypothetical protein